MSDIVSNPQAGQGRPLPKKEADTFKTLIKQYESKQYKKAIKAADSILKKFPNHGETLAMKGLTMYYANTSINHHEEAHQLVKLALRNDMRSHVCWHVYGLLHRADRNYGEAIKAYKQALRIDSENLQILRDLSLLQIQMRDWEGYVITRNSILTLKPTAQANWISFALAKHRSGNYTGALHVIDIYLGTLTDESPERKRGYTSSELQLYKNRLLLQSSQPQEALQHLDQCRTMVVDQDAWLWHTAVCHFALQQYDDARQALYQMMKRGSTEDYRVHMAYQCAALQLPWSSTIESSSTGMNTLANTQILNASQRDHLLQLYQQDLLTAFPKSSAIRRIPLTLLEGDDLCSYLMTYMRQSLIRGVPSLANDLGSLLVVPVEQDNDDDNVDNDDQTATTLRRYRRLSDPVEYVTHPTYQMISKIAQEYSQNLHTCSKFHPNDDEDCPTNSAYLWVLMFQAGWSAMAGQFSDALSFVERVLAMVDGDSKLDAYELHASIIQRSTDDWVTAAGILDDARAMDPNDRYLNTQTIRAYLRANQWQTAIDRAGLFTHSSGGGNNNTTNGGDATTKKKTTVEMLREMQASWFELELADCRVRLGHYGAALQTYADVMKHFEDIHEDQFDFHAYCIRKVTLRAYCDVLQWEDELWGQVYYRQAAEGTIRVYLSLYDDPTLVSHVKEPDYSTLSAAERKKAKAAARKKKKVGGGDDEMEGKDLLLKDSLEECRKLLSLLTKHAPKELSTWILQYDVSIRRGKYMMALQALFRAKALDRHSHELLTRVVDFGRKMETLGHEELSSLPSVVSQVLRHEYPRLLHPHGTTIQEYLNHLSSSCALSTVSNSSSLSYRIAVAQIMESYESLVTAGLTGRDVRPDTCRKAYQVLRSLKAPDNALEAWVRLVQDRFPGITKLE